jgi:hypothetical protein
MPMRARISAQLFTLIALCVFSPLAHAGEDWLPITPEELKTTTEPKAPGAPAIYLDRQVDRDDVEYRETIYARIKIFTDEGRKYANVDLPFVKGFGDIKNIKARTIQPDGSIANFDGKVYERTIEKAKGVKILAKTFTMPDVQTGGIIEYRYTRILPAGWVYDSQWLLSEELFTKHARFSLRKNNTYAMRMSWPRGLPDGTKPPAMDQGTIRLETQNIPAFQIEDYMPPPDEMKIRVEFIYTSNLENDRDKFWKDEAKGIYLGIAHFIDKRKAMEEAVAAIISPADTPEQKLEKIYARCQKIRNTTLERDKTKQERSREKLKDVGNVEDVWKRGYGNGSEITWLFLALARAGGFEASPVMISTRDRHLFDAKLMKPWDLNTNVVLVKLNGKDIYLDPGIAFAPFGLLPWHETGVTGLRVDAAGGAWIITTLPRPAESGMERKATLQLDDAGALEGKASITFKGVSALRRRLDEYQEDDAQRKKFLEDEIKSYIPVPVEVELSNLPDWNSSSTILVAEYNLKVPGWASVAGRRTLLSVGLFSGSEKHVFEGASRVHPIYFSFPYSDDDDVTITLPPRTQISNLPQPQHVDQKVCSFGLTAESKEGSLHITRNLVVDVHMMGPKYYDSLRTFFQAVRSGDEQQVVLSPEAASAQN